MSLVEVTTKSWAEFKGLIISDQFGEQPFRRGRFLFRGQGDAGWKLQSGFDRWYRGDPARKKIVSGQLIDAFKQECEQTDLPASFTDSPEAWLGLAQHSGLPTRLLDWSESPYVAAFFAFSGHIRSTAINLTKTVAVWVIDSQSHIWDDDNGCAVMRVPSFGNARMANQQGWFTHLKSPSTSLEEHIAAFGIANESTFRKYSIPVNEMRTAIADLDAMGLNYARIYPGLEGNARAAEVRVGLDRT
jgi:hypothetical protein